MNCARTRALPAFVFALLLLSGCGAGEFLDSIDADDGGATAEYDHGSRSTGEHAEIPDEVAEVITVPDGFTATTSFRADDEAQTEFTVGGEITGEGDDLRDALLESIADGDWVDVNETEMAMDGLTQVTWSATDADGAVLRVIFAHNPDLADAQVNLTYTAAAGESS